MTDNNKQRPKSINTNAVAKRLAQQLDAEKKRLYSWPTSEELNPKHTDWVQLFGRQ